MPVGASDRIEKKKKCQRRKNNSSPGQSLTFRLQFRRWSLLESVRDGWWYLKGWHRPNSETIFFLEKKHFVSPITAEMAHICWEVTSTREIWIRCWHRDVVDATQGFVTIIDQSDGLWGMNSLSNAFYRPSRFGSGVSDVRWHPRAYVHDFFLKMVWAAGSTWIHKKWWMRKSGRVGCEVATAVSAFAAHSLTGGRESIPSSIRDQGTRGP
jgi:hypothetical protein